MKRSIRVQLIVTILGLIMVLMGLNLLINNVFLEKYYIRQRENDLVRIYQGINQVSNVADYQSDSFMDRFRILSEAKNIELTVLQPQDINRSVSRIVFQTVDSKLMRGRIEGYLLGFVTQGDEEDVLIDNVHYQIRRFKDSMVGIDYLEEWGDLDNGCYFLMRIPLDSIQESVAIANRFTAYIVLIGAVFAILFVWLLSARITDPIRELTVISRRMADLDFDAKYTSGGSDEIGQLGEHFNKMSETLEKTISELKTANNELQRDLAQKEKIDEMRKEFLSNVSHELKTPIALVQGYAEGLKECINDDEDSRDFYCDVIMDEASKMNHMVQKLLTLNQLEFGTDVVNIDRFDLGEMLRGIVAANQLLADQKGAKLVCTLQGALHVWGDEFKVEEVITNYISNACNHVEGRKYIEVSARVNNGKAHVSVFNTGHTIPEEELDKIWTKFYKVDKARTRAYGGSGIGLSIVKAIMDSHNQNYGVVNHSDGVEFWFELDCADCPERRE